MHTLELSQSATELFQGSVIKSIRKFYTQLLHTREAKTTENAIYCEEHELLTKHEDQNSISKSSQASICDQKYTQMTPKTKEHEHKKRETCLGSKSLFNF